MASQRDQYQPNSGEKPPIPPRGAPPPIPMRSPSSETIPQYRRDDIEQIQGRSGFYQQRNITLNPMDLINIHLIQTGIDKVLILIHNIKS